MGNHGDSKSSFSAATEIKRGARPAGRRHVLRYERRRQATCATLPMRVRRLANARVVAAIVLGILASTFGQVQARAQTARPQLTVRLYDSLGVHSSDVMEAGRTVRDILSRAGIDVTWSDCRPINPTAALCDRPVGARDVLVRIIADPGTAPEVLGYAAIDPGTNSGRLATVFGDSVERLAERGMSDRGRLLGRVIAHEIGHLVLGSASHSERGLMRPKWSIDEMRRDRAKDWLMSADDAERLQRDLEVRLQLRPGE